MRLDFSGDNRQDRTGSVAKSGLKCNINFGKTLVCRLLLSSFAWIEGIFMYENIIPC
jgi:hypothetical protein